MRIVIVGTTPEAVMTARLLVERGHGVVLLESNRERIDELAEELDCSFLHGDGTNPAVLSEANPEDTDVLFCLTDEDQVNILASLVGRSQKFARVITSIQNPEFEGICRELGLEEIIVPDRTISRYLGDLVEGLDVLELRTVIKYDARFFSFTAADPEHGRVAELELPENARVVCLYRDGRFLLADENTAIESDDEVVILTHRKNLPALRERWQPGVAEGGSEED